MRVIILLGTNFVRTQWVAVAVMTAYLAGAGVLFGWHQQRADVQFYVQWHSANAILIGALIAVPAIWSERRSRRILAVLSKGIARWQYLGGLLCGCAMISAWFTLLIGTISYWLCFRGAIPTGGLLSLMLAVLLCSVTAESAALLMAAMLHPLLAMVATSVLLLFPLGIESSGWHPASELFPVASLVQVLRSFRFQPAGTGLWRIAAGAIAEAVLFWAVGSAIFSRRDVTISPE
ncbi:MAG TPA: hypothetical protein VKW06_07470 [Candidatus Angelobacter sp.]|nr:hypothetical protein [Candidatus Angelobacter sp.]